jgi:NosR/NirI family transcriptional regulator, nitrous oxide reductase regulator
MFGFLKRYTHWLHGQWPSGTVENLPEIGQDGTTVVSGLYVVGDLTGIPLLKFSADTGARAVDSIARDARFKARKQQHEVRDLVIIGAGISGMSAALEAKKQGLNFVVLETSEPFSTVVNFPKKKPIYSYPTEMVPSGSLQFSDRADVKERLLTELQDQTAQVDVRIEKAEYVAREKEILRVVVPQGEDILAHRVIVAIGRSGNFRRLGVPGEGLDKVYNRLHDPHAYTGREVLVVGGGDSALETAIAVSEAGGRVTLSYRRGTFSRPKPENISRIETLARGGTLRLLMGSEIQEITESRVVLATPNGETAVNNDFVFSMLGREAPLDFFRRSGVPIRGEWRKSTWGSFILILLACVFLYHWKTAAGIPIYDWFKAAKLFPFNLSVPDDATSLMGTIRISMTQPSFYYSFAYCACVVGFGFRRIRRRKTPYVTVQTLTLMAIQCVPLFLLPYIFLPWMGHQGWFSDGSTFKPFADALFPLTEWDPHGREYWRSLGLVLAWPLFVWNVFTSEPMWTWLIISLVQTFVLIPLIVWRWGKGAYCGWICSCGALAETMGDAQRHKMPHGPVWNRVNRVGQVILGFVGVLFVLRVAGWMLPYDHWVNAAYMGLFMGKSVNWSWLPFPLNFLNYVWSVDLMMAGIIGVGFYWHFSGRVWCRFACPLAALMHIYARFSKFRIFADKKKCISCNVCTSVCHQGIDVMSFANKGLPMEDPECVRCSACVGSCPTGVLTFGQINAETGEMAKADKWAASPVQMREGT